MTPPSRISLAATIASLFRPAQPSRRNGPSSPTSSAVRDEWDEDTPVGERLHEPDELFLSDPLRCPTPAPVEVYDDERAEDDDDFDD